MKATKRIAAAALVFAAALSANAAGNVKNSKGKPPRNHHWGGDGG
jgi:hypothetical protein